MNELTDCALIAERFATVAQQFCSAVEGASSAERADLLLRIYRMLPTLIAEAINLPRVTSDDEDEPNEPTTSQPRADARLNEQQLAELYKLLKAKFGDWDGYWQTFDPTEHKEADYGSLADDIADIYRDLKEGIVLLRAQEAPPEDVIWRWRVLYYSHWGPHAVDALRTIHSRLRDQLE